jgi:hypothetical protein
MTDSLRLLATVAHLQAQDSGAALEKIASDQKAKITEKKNVRDVQQKYSEIMSDDKVTFDELQNLHEMQSAFGVTDESFWNESGRVRGADAIGGWEQDASLGTGNSRFYFETGDSSDASQRAGKAMMENIKNRIDGTMDGLNDDQQLLQFEIQMATSEMQNAESTRSQAEKRLEDQRKDLRRNWAG